jgi:hypothetical protein
MRSPARAPAGPVLRGLRRRRLRLRDPPGRRLGSRGRRPGVSRAPAPAFRLPAVSARYRRAEPACAHWPRTRRPILMPQPSGAGVLRRACHRGAWTATLVRLRQSPDRAPPSRGIPIGGWLARAIRYAACSQWPGTLLNGCTEFSPSTPLVPTPDPRSHSCRKTFFLLCSTPPTGE